MQTVTVDDSKRILIPDAEPGQSFAYEKDGELITLTPLRKEDGQTISGKLVRRNGRLIVELPAGFHLAEGPIEREVPR